MTESDREDKGFKVTDRRKFTSDGEIRSEAEERPSEREESSPEPAPDPSPKRTQPSEPGTTPPPEVGFADLMTMLATNAFMQLGEIPEPISGKREENLQGAQVMISFLTVLQEKTKGNLSNEESKALDDLLYELRMRFMSKANLFKR